MAQRFFATLTALAAAISSVNAQLQDDIDRPPAVAPGTCKRLDFNLSGVDAPNQVDVVVRVDESGNPVSAQTLSHTNNSALLSAVSAVALSCRYLPAVTGGRPTAGVARFAYVIRQTESQKPGASPAIANVQDCAPKAEDYPPEARRHNQTGTTRVGFTTDAKGQLAAFGVVKSSGHLQLDFTALIKLAGCKFVPGKAADGSPIGGTFTVDYVWKLE